jgi:hypothetical protein
MTINCSCVTFVARLNGSLDVITGQYSIVALPICDISCTLIWVPVSFLLCMGLHFPTYTGLRRPIELLHDTGGRQRLTSAGQGFVTGAIRARTSEYIKAAHALVSTTFSIEPTLYHLVDFPGQLNLNIRYG